ncbi:MAG: hypothetical protein U0350_34395 [Caldilineaceae bacterium]
MQKTTNATPRGIRCFLHSLLFWLGYEAWVLSFSQVSLSMGTT